MNEITISIPELHMLILRSHKELSKLDALAERHDLAYSWALDADLKVSAEFEEFAIELEVAA